MGIRIFTRTKRPKKLPDAFIIGERFVGKENVAMILRDQFFYGQNLSVSSYKIQSKKGASCFT